jgi:enamine deaminase RidA (YjgF/YER057c/UK114 family)
MNRTRRTLLRAAAGAGALAVPVAGAPAASSKKQTHYVGEKPQGVPLFPIATSYGDLVFVSGHGVNDVHDVAEQTRRVLDKIRQALESAGSSMQNALKCTVYLADIRDYAAMNEAYRGSFGGDPPARTTIGIAAIPLEGCRVEIEVIAHR